MKQLTQHEMETVGGGFIICSFIYNMISSISALDIAGQIKDIFNNTPSAPKKEPSPTTSSFKENMQKMFGASAGRDLAKVAESIGIVDIVNSIFGWE
ncbi:TPA: hypothetical protein M2P09_004288 [Klebsiella quasipneumoniae]|nr:hypothetical protein [Klebsiella quasipneumoniae]